MQNPASKLNPWDSAEHLASSEQIALYLDACLDEGDPALVAHALGIIARARGITELARDAGLSREWLYETLSGRGNPDFTTVMKVIEALRLRHRAPNSAKPGAT